MNYQNVLNKKRERLTKYTGRKLKLKTAAYEKAVARFGGTAESVVVEPPKAKAKPAEKPVVVETGTPEWTVTPPDGKSFVVRATAEKKARAEARMVLGTKSLPPGTTVVKNG